MIPRDYQIELAKTAYEVLRDFYIVYLAAEERTGKTLSAILVAEMCNNVENILVITKKKAKDGWNETFADFEHTKNYTVTNYHQVNKVKAKYDLVILDESHNYISSYPKVGNLWRDCAGVCRDVPIIYISATPHPQGYQQLYHQFKLSSWSPWAKYQNFYKWFKVYGIPVKIEINSIEVTQYTKTKEEMVLATCEHLFVTKTRKELGFEQEPTDQLHYIEPYEATRKVYNELLEHQVVRLKAGKLVCDSKAKLRASLHMLEGGTAKIGDEYITLANDEKIQYILNTWGDTDDLVIMYNYQEEQRKLEAVFQEASILQATSFAEGVDLHQYKNLVIYSQDFSTGRHTQRRARQANFNRKEPIIVHYLLFKKGVSAQVYKTVSVNKKNFVDSVFEREQL